jgi:hypothetical protein
MYAQRKQWPLRAVHVDVRFTREGKEGAIARVLSFEGELDDAQRTRLADIAERTPVTLTLMQGVPITTIGLTLPVACRLRAGVGRPDSGAPLSMPLPWEELEAAQPLDFRVGNVLGCLEKAPDRWHDVL